MPRSSLASVAAAAAAAAVASAQQGPTWYGLTPSASSSSAVDLVTLNDAAVIGSTLGTVKLAVPGSIVWPDGMRCVRGFCIFAATFYAGGGNATSLFYTCPWRRAPPR